MLRSRLAKFCSVKLSLKTKRLFSDHSHDGPHVPEGYAKLGKFCLVITYLWVFYKLKEDKGQLFGFYKPWLHEHEHEEHVQFQGIVGEMPTIADDEDGDEDCEESD
jgi:hypothetical protein